MGVHDENAAVTLHAPDGRTETHKAPDTGQPNLGKLSAAENSPVDPGKLEPGERGAQHDRYTPARPLGAIDEIIGAGRDGVTTVVKHGDAGVDAGKLLRGEHAADGGHGHHPRSADDLSISVVKPPDSPLTNQGKAAAAAPGDPSDTHAPAGRMIPDSAPRAADPNERARLNEEARDLAREITHHSFGRGRGGLSR